MKYVVDRKLDHTQGIYNFIAHYFGVKAMCSFRAKVPWIRDFKIKRSNLKELEQLYKKHPEIPNADAWYRTHQRFLKECNFPAHMTVVREFYECEFELTKDFAEEYENESGLTVVCTERNEITRLRKFLPYYRNAGIRQFVFIDNGSTDGTLEFLSEQPDVRVYKTPHTYTSPRKTAWNNRAAAEIGLKRWYMQADADEFAWYAENQGLKQDFNEYIDKLQNRNIYSVKGMMLDMYPSDVLGDEKKSPDNFLEEYTYYDKDSNYYNCDPDENFIYGGYMGRILQEDNHYLTKVPLIFMEEGRMFAGSHRIYPWDENIEAEYGIFLKHYKFIPGDEKRVREAIEKKQYANGSMHYVKYLKFYEDGGLSVYSPEYSCKWDEKTILTNFPMVKTVEQLSKTR